MARWLLNVALLSGKELRSLLKDVTLMGLIVFAFTVGIYSVAKGVKAEVSNASIAVLDGDHSELSRRLRYALHQPYFKPPEDIERADVQDALDRGRYIFVVEFPPRLEVDVLAQRNPAVQVLVDATAMTQAGLGTSYINEIFLVEALDFLHSRGIDAAMPLKVKSRLQFNPNGDFFLVHVGDADRHEYHGAGDRLGGRRGDQRAGARNDRTFAGHAGARKRDRRRQDRDQRLRHSFGGNAVIMAGRAFLARRADLGIDRPFCLWRRAFPLFRDRARDVVSHDFDYHAAVRVADRAGLHHPVFALGSRDASGEHAPHAAIHREIPAHDAICRDGSGDTLS